MTVKEAADKLGVKINTLYRKIYRKHGIGKHFKKNEFGIWVVDGRKVK